MIGSAPATGPLVAGIDCSTQATKVVVRNGHTGALVRAGRADHPPGTEIDPEEWWTALQHATAGGLLDGVAAVAVAAQQHGLVAVDDRGKIVRPALLWNDTRSADAATELIDELGGAAAWAAAVGSVPVSSFTVSKLRWLAEHEPINARRTETVMLPHDYLTWRILGDLAAEPVTDRGDVSGTGYWSPQHGEYRLDLLERALGHAARVPRVMGPRQAAGELAGGALVAPGTGDNMAAALGVDARPGDVVVSIGTSGTACAVENRPAADPSGVVAGFADATGRFLPLVATLNAARVLVATAAMLGVDLDQLDDLALSACAGAGGLVLLPYLEGERTPNRPSARGMLAGIRLSNASPANVARAAVEGLLCSLADGIDGLRAQGVRVHRVILIGGGARSRAVQSIAPSVLDAPVTVPSPAENVADGAARQAAWVLSEEEVPPPWPSSTAARIIEAERTPHVREAYAAVRDSAG